MQTLIVKTESEAATKLLLAFLKTVRLVKSVTLLSPETATDVLNEPADAYNWVNPSRPATDEEIEQLCLEMDVEEAEGKYFTMEEAKAKTLKSLEQWKKKGLK